MLESYALDVVEARELCSRPATGDPVFVASASEHERVTANRSWLGAKAPSSRRDTLLG